MLKSRTIRSIRKVKKIAKIGAKSKQRKRFSTTKKQDMENENIDPTVVASFNVSELKQHLKSRNLSLKGKKAELRKRLLNSIKKNSVEAAAKNEQQENVNVKVTDFNLYINEYEEFKAYIINRMNGLHEKYCAQKQVETSNVALVEAIQSENAALKHELSNKQEIIKLLMENLEEKNSMSKAEWQIPSRHVPQTCLPKQKVIPISTNNRFSSLQGESYDVNSSHTDTSNEIQPVNRINNRQQTNQSYSNSESAFRRNGFPIEQHPERNVQLGGRKIGNRTTHSTYSDIVRNGKKITIIGDSMIKRVYANEFNKALMNGRAYIKSFRGATSNEIDHYIEPSLSTNLPDVVIIHAGANDVRRKKKQKNETIANDIVNIARKCRNYGVKEIAVSGIISQKNNVCAERIKIINQMVSDICAAENFYFIDNRTITEEYLWTDGIHLLDHGTEVLVNNFLGLLSFL